MAFSLCRAKGLGRLVCAIRYLGRHNALLSSSRLREARHHSARKPPCLYVGAYCRRKKRARALRSLLVTPPAMATFLRIYSYEYVHKCCSPEDSSQAIDSGYSRVITLLADVTRHGLSTVRSRFPLYSSVWSPVPAPGIARNPQCPQAAGTTLSDRGPSR